MGERITVTIEGPVAEVVLDRPEKRNALDLPAFEELAEAGDRLAAESAVRAVVLHGAGENFCAGIDLGLFADGVPSIDVSSMSPQGNSPANLYQRAAYAWRELPVPVICAITGAAFGGGLQIALGADVRYARPDARLSVMEIEWGLIPDMGISVTARHLVALDRLRELAYSGRVIDGGDALALGLVTALHDDPLRKARETAAAVAGRSPDAIRSMKRLFNEAWQMTDAESLALEAKLQTRLMGKPNQLEAVRAKLAKRKPVYRDRGD